MRPRPSRLVCAAGGLRRSVAVAATLAALMVFTGVPGSLPAYGDDGAWTRQFGTSGLDEAKAVAADAEGGTYAVGETFGALPGQTPAGTLDAFVRKYDSAGQEVWTRQFGAWERDIAWGVTVDHLGSAYVVGQTEGILPAQQSAGGLDAFVRKYDSSGTEIWTRQFGGGGADVASGVAADPSGGLYVVGTTSSVLPGQAHSGSFDAFVRRYDAGGQEMWTRQFGTKGGDNARRVAVDQQGQLLVVGSTEGTLSGQTPSGGFDVFVSLFQPDGRQQWIRQFGSGGDDYGVAVVVDGAGGISVAGTADRALPGGGAGTTFLRRFDVSGTVMWTEQFGTGESDDAWDVTVDGDGAAYLVGTTQDVLPGQRSAGRLDAFVRKYSVNGEELWTRQYGTPEDDHAFGIALTGRGIALAGSTRGVLADRSAGQLDAYVMHLTMAGTR